MNVIDLKHLTYTYAGKTEPALKNINLTVDEGEFVLLLGVSGSGKSTLARVISGSVPDFYGGEITGQAELNEKPCILFQDPEKQMIMNKVEREIAFPLENQSVPETDMLRRVSEVLSFMNIFDLKDRTCHSLSGGQKQKVALGATVVGGQRLLVLDEPISQLDPVSADEILEIIKRLNHDLGYTIMMVEQRVDKCFHLADRIVFMEDGEIAFNDSPARFIEWASAEKSHFVPRIGLFFSKMNYVEKPLKVKEARKVLRSRMPDVQDRGLPANVAQTDSTISTDKELADILSMEKVTFGYRKKVPVLNDCSFGLKKGEILTIMGENGSGKSTLLKLIAGLVQPDRGRVKTPGTIGYVSQNPNDYLFNDSVAEELRFTLKQFGKVDEAAVMKTLEELDLTRYADTNPRDLSGGERQRAAIASVLVNDPPILMLDEPTRGLDRALKEKLMGILKYKRDTGGSVIVVTHDVEFASEISDKVLLLFEGSITALSDKYDVLTNGLYYTTVMNRLFRGYNDEILTVDDACNFMTQWESGGCSL